MVNSKAIKDETMKLQILQAALHLCKQHGFNKLTMDDVAKAMNMGRSSLYYYYAGIEDLHLAVKDAAIKEALEEITHAVDAAATAEDKIKAFCRVTLTAVRKRKLLYQISSENPNEARGAMPGREERRRSYIKKEGEILDRIFIDSAEKGELKKLGEKDRDVLVFVLVSGMNQLQKEIPLDKNYPVEPAVEALTQLILKGIKG